MGRVLGLTLDIFVWDISVIWGDKMGDSLQVHVLGDPGMEVMPESGGCMWYKRCKNNDFRDISLLPLSHEFSVSREGFRLYFRVFW